MSQGFRIPKKLIEVALPLDVINAAAAREKSIRHGHPSTLHLWWARRPLAAARAVLFAQMVNDPGYERHLGRGVNKVAAEAERRRLFELIGRLVQWENTTNEAVLEEAREEIRKSWRETCELNKNHPDAAELFNPDKLPAFHDPFAGGGSIPLEAQRLGLEAHASDLNPVAVLINKAMIEIPPKFAGKAPVGPAIEGKASLPNREWKGAQGLAEDVRRYGHWMREEALKRIGHLYPPVEVTAEMAEERPDLKALVGQKLTVVAWLWVRTVKSDNPAYSHVEVPLASTFLLSSKEGKCAYVAPVISDDSYKFVVRFGTPPDEARFGTKMSKGANFYCVMSGFPMSSTHVKREGASGRMGAKLMAIVLDGPFGRIYVSPESAQESWAFKNKPSWKPEQLVSLEARNCWTAPYGLTTFGDLFTSRQLIALTTFCGLIHEFLPRIEREAVSAGWNDDGLSLSDGGNGAKSYSEAIAFYLSIGLDKMADYNSSLVIWSSSRDQVKTTFSRQVLPMSWDFAEVNLFANGAGDFNVSLNGACRAIELLGGVPGESFQQDARFIHGSADKIFSTDPPYYDNIGYADLSDFFYVWIRKSVGMIFPKEFSTLTVPKIDELVATAYRHKGKDQAEKFFLNGMSQAMRAMSDLSHPAFPVSIYYAFKSSEAKNNDISNTGWDTFLDAVIRSGFSLVGTWPMRTERDARSIGIGTNALASSIVLVCQKRAITASTITRRDFLRELRATLPEALFDMTFGSKDAAPIAPVDLAQAAIGPGMAIYSRHAAVLEGDGTPMTVRTALALINREVDAYFNQGDGDLDADTRFCLDWFAQAGWKEGAFGEADVLARAKGTSVQGLGEAGVVASGGGKVRLLKPSEYPSDWDPANDDRLPLWEALHHLVRVFQAGGEVAAAALLRELGPREEALRTLAYRLYTDCERKKWAADARPYNELVQAWEAIKGSLARLQEELPSGQQAMFAEALPVATGPAKRRGQQTLPGMPAPAAQQALPGLEEHF